MLMGGLIAGMSGGAAVRLLAWLITVAVVVSAGWSAAAESEWSADAERLSISQICELDDQELTRGRQLSIVGIVTRVMRRDGIVRHLVVQDESAGIWVSTLFAREQGLWADSEEALVDLAVGKKVEVVGRAVIGGFGPHVIPERIRVLGEGRLPEPVPVDAEGFFAGDYTGQRIEATGVVQEFSQVGDGLELTIEFASRRYVALVPRHAFSDPSSTLVDAKVRLRGVAIAGFNGRGEFLYPRVFVDDPADLVVLSPPRSPPFEARNVPLRAIAGMRAEPLAGHRVRTEGTVVAHDGKNVFFVQEGATGVRVETQRPSSFRPGDRVEIAGFLDRRRTIAGITGAVARVMDHEAAPEATLISPAAVVATAEQAANRGQMVVPGDYDGCLVRFPARLIAAEFTRAGGRLTLAAEGLDAQIAATAIGDAFTGMKPIETGSELMVTGVLHIHHSPVYRVGYVPRVESLSLTLRSPDDIAVVRSPPWWNARRLTLAAAALAAVLAAALAWAVLLRRQVALETSRAATEMRKRRDASIEFEATLRERSRLAANLHDTLLQALAGAVFQLDLCRRSLLGARVEEAGDQMDVAKRMVKHAAADLRNSVWALRTAPLAGRSFPESMAAIVAHLGSDGTVRIGLRFAGEPFPLPNFVAGNIMLVVQEAVRNAVAHGRPSSVDIIISYTAHDRRIGISVSDDGAGFEMGTQRGPDQGHFGLQGMRERIEGLGGRFSIDTAPGRGTRIEAHVSVQTHDADIEEPAAEPLESVASVA